MLRSLRSERSSNEFVAGPASPCRNAGGASLNSRRPMPLSPPANPTPQVAQLVAAGLVALWFAAISCGVAVRLRRGRPTPTRLARALTLLGVLATAGVLAWHLFPQVFAGRWRPFGDNFEALLWLGLLPAVFVASVQSRRPVPGLELFMLPPVVLLLGAAAVAEAWWPREYDLRGGVIAVHRVASYGGAAAFAVAAVAGVLYLRQSGRLRDKTPLSTARHFGGLERLETWSVLFATLGFCLLTVGLVTGLARLETATVSLETLTPKIALACGVWLVYAVALHAPLLPRFSDLRGRGAAWLSVAGFALMVLALLAVQWTPTGRIGGVQ